MHDMTAARRHAAASRSVPKHQRWYPTIYDLRRGAQRRLPHFAFEYGDGGAGDDTGIKHNWAALDAIEMVPRYGVDRRTAAGRCRAVRPPLRRAARRRADGQPDRGLARRREAALAQAAQRARVPYTLGCAGGATIEEIGEDRARRVLVPALSFRRERSRHRLRSDASARERAGVHVLMLTLDVPVRTKRPREVQGRPGGGGRSSPTGA